MSGSVHVPFYATVFRGDKLHAAIEEIAAVSMHYGATEWSVYRYRDDAYKLLLSVDFDSKEDWDRYWNGPEFVDFRIANQSYYQVPLLYGWTNRSTSANGAFAN
jgi:hypothetical protein